MADFTPAVTKCKENCTTRLLQSEIISPGQFGYMKGRLISNLIEYSRIANVSNIILLANFEKAFDTIKWSFSPKSWDTMALGMIFIK